jgi:hypothetical protein
VLDARPGHVLAVRLAAAGGFGEALAPSKRFMILPFLDV